MIGIYKITNPKGKVYIGQSINIEQRKQQYQKSPNKKQVLLYRSFVKYGFSEHIFEVVEECFVEDLNTRERYWQDYYNVLQEGLNLRLTETFDRSGQWSDTVKQKMSGSHKGKSSREGTKHSEEAKKKIGEASKGRVSTRRGVPRSEEVKNKISEANKGRGTGRVMSQETREKMSEAKRLMWISRKNKLK